MKKTFCVLLIFMYILSAFPAVPLIASAENSELISITEVGNEYFEQTIAMYEDLEAEFGDPQVEGYTDADFFGVYDGAEWTTPSLLNYEDFPELSAVEEAAKNGDYETAKVEIQAYYKEKFSGTALTKGKSTSNAILNSALLFIENAYGSDVRGFIKLTRDLQSHEINMREAVVAALDTSSKRMGLIFAGIRKDGNSGIIYSKESEYVPVLNVTVNGRSKEYTPVTDTYVSPGDNLYTNYGSEPILMISESYSTVDAPKKDKVDSYTNRGYLMFDLSDIGENDTVNNATLTVTGNAIESHCPEKPDTIPEYTDIAVCSTENINYEEDTLTWSSFSSDYVSASGEYSLGIDNNLTISSNYSPPVIMYNATGEDAYAYAATRVITGAIRFLFTDAYGYKEQATLGNSQFVSDFCWYVGDLCRFPEHIMTPEKFTLVLKFVHATTQEAVNRWSNGEEAGNWGVVNACGIAIAAMLYPEFAVADDELIPSANTSLPGGVKGGWKEVGNYRIIHTAEMCLLDDGSCTETSYAYTKYILNQYSRFFRVADAMEIDVHEVLSQEALDVFEQYLLFLMSASNPGGGGWGQGDCSISHGEVNALESYTTIIKGLNNPQLSWFVNNESSGETPDFLSTAYDSGMKATLRSSWDKKALGAFINADGSGMVHSHNDDLSLSVYAYGKMLLADPTQPNYDTNQPVTNLLYSTRGHNTVEINGTNAAGPGKSMTFTNAEGEEETIISGNGGGLGSLHPENREFNGIYNFIQAETLGYTGNDSLDENFKQLREVLMLSPEYFIVTDRVTPDGSDGENDDNTYSQYWHSVPDANMTVDSETGVAKTHFDSGANLTIAPVEGAVSVNASKHFSWYGTENVFADFVRYDMSAPGPVNFNTVIYPTVQGDDVTLSTQNLSVGLSEGEASAFAFTVLNEKTDAEKKVHFYSLHNSDKKESRTFGEYTTDAELSLVQTVNGSYDKIVLRNGTFINTKEGTPVLASESGISDLGISWNDGEITLESSKYFVDKSLVNTALENENLALGKSGVSSLHFDNTKIEDAFDGNSATGWSAATVEGEEELPWLALNLQSVQGISKITVTDNDSSVEYTFSYLNDDGEWVEIRPANVYLEPFGDENKPVKNYCFAPVETSYIKIQSNKVSNLQIYEMEAYSSLANAISLYDLKIYAPGNVSDVIVNGESVSVYKNGDYLVFCEELAGDTSSPDTGGSTGSIGGKDHGSGGSPGGSGGSGGSSSENKDEDSAEENNTSNEEDKKTAYDSEIEGHWGEKEISAMIEKGIVKGDGASLNLKSPVTRAEFAALLIRALDIEEKSYNNEFSDVKSDEWYADILAAAKAAGLLEGSDGMALPNDILTREQMAKMLVSAKEYLGAEITATEKLNFSDKGDISDWAQEYIAKAVSASLMNGMGDNMFSPKGTALREQAFAAVYRLIEK